MDIKIIHWEDHVCFEPKNVITFFPKKKNWVTLAKFIKYNYNKFFVFHKICLKQQLLFFLSLNPSKFIIKAYHNDVGDYIYIMYAYWPFLLGYAIEHIIKYSFIFNVSDMTL